MMDSPLRPTPRKISSVPTPASPPPPPRWLNHREQRRNGALPCESPSQTSRKQQQNANLRRRHHSRSSSEKENTSVGIAIAHIPLKLNTDFRNPARLRYFLDDNSFENSRVNSIAPVGRKEAERLSQIDQEGPLGFPGRYDLSAGGKLRCPTLNSSLAIKRVMKDIQKIELVDKSLSKRPIENKEGSGTDRPKINYGLWEKRFAGLPPVEKSTVKAKKPIRRRIDPAWKRSLQYAPQIDSLSELGRSAAQDVDLFSPPLLSLESAIMEGTKFIEDTTADADMTYIDLDPVPSPFADFA